MKPDAWKMVVGNVLTYNGFVVRILRLNEAGDGVDKMEALNTEFMTQERLVELIEHGFEKDLDGNYIYEVNSDKNETHTT